MLKRRLPLDHAPRAARGAESALLAGERRPLIIRALGTAQLQKTVGQDAAFEEGFKLVEGTPEHRRSQTVDREPCGRTPCEPRRAKVLRRSESDLRLWPFQNLLNGKSRVGRQI